MDILSHGLWAVATGKGARIGSQKQLNWKWLFFWGVFPDLFAFVPIMFVSVFSIIAGGKGMIHKRPTELEPWTPGFESLSSATEYLYQLSHSLVILALVILVFYLIKKSVPWVVLGWLLHILADIPTHSYTFYPTPALWPFWDWKFDGFSWGSGHFTLYNYLALASIFLLLYLYKRFGKPHF